MNTGNKVQNFEYNANKIDSDIELISKKLSLIKSSQYKIFIERFVDNYNEFIDDCNNLVASFNDSFLSPESQLQILKKYYHLYISLNENYTPEDADFEKSLDNLIAFLTKANSMQAA